MKYRHHIQYNNGKTPRRNEEQQKLLKQRETLFKKARNLHTIFCLSKYNKTINFYFKYSTLLFTCFCLYSIQDNHQSEYFSSQSKQMR